MKHSSSELKVVRILLKVNLARRISDHLLGEDHPLKHRMVVGGGLMVIGVGIANILPGSLFHSIFDIVGYMLHGTGTIPFIDWLSRTRSPGVAAQDPIQQIISEGQKQSV